MAFEMGCRSNFDIVSYCPSLGFCCYRQVYGIFNVSHLGVILQVRGRDGMSIPQNGVAAYLVSRITYFPGWFLVAFRAVFTFLSILLLW